MYGGKLGKAKYITSKGVPGREGKAKNKIKNC